MIALEVMTLLNLFQLLQPHFHLDQDVHQHALVSWASEA
jgi:hypothetical protein